MPKPNRRRNAAARARWRSLRWVHFERSGVLVAIATSLVAAYFAYRSSVQSDEAMRLSRADFEARRTVRFQGEVRQDSADVTVRLADIHFPQRVGDTIYVPRTPSATWRISLTMWHDAMLDTPPRDTTIRVRYAVLALRPIRSEMSAQSITVTTPWASAPQPGSSAADPLRTILYTPNFNLPLPQVERRLAAMLDSLRAAAPSFMPRMGSSAIPLLVESEVVAEGEIRRATQRYDLHYEYRYNQSPGDAAQVTVRGISYAADLTGNENALTAVRSQYHQARKKLSAVIFRSRHSDMQKLATDLAEQVRVLHARRIALFSRAGRVEAQPGEIPQIGVPLPALARGHSSLPREVTQRVLTFQDVVAEYNRRADSVRVGAVLLPDGRTVRTKATWSRFPEETDTWRELGLALGLWALSGLSNRTSATFPLKTESVVARDGTERFTVFVGRNRLSVSGPTTSTCLRIDASKHRTKPGSHEFACR